MPHVQYFQSRAKELLRAVKSGDPDALAFVADAGVKRPGITLQRAQHAIAVSAGFASWAGTDGLIRASESVLLAARSRVPRFAAYEEVRSVTDTSTARLKAFVSYKWESDEHVAWVEKLARDLRANGIASILDRWEVRFGGSFTDYMQKHVNDADVILFVITPGAVKAAEAEEGQGGALKFEVQMANARRIKDGTRIIGIYRAGERPPHYLRDHRYADFRRDDKYDSSLRELIDDLLGRTGPPPVGPIAQPVADETKRLRRIALTQMPSILTLHIERLWEFYKAATAKKPEREPATLDEMFSDDYFEQIRYLDFSRTFPLALKSPPQTWMAVTARRMAEFEKSLSAVIQKYASVLGADLLEPIEQCASSTFVNSLMQGERVEAVYRERGVTGGWLSFFDPSVVATVREHTVIVRKLVKACEDAGMPPLDLPGMGLLMTNIHPMFGSARVAGVPAESQS